MNFTIKTAILYLPLKTQSTFLQDEFANIPEPSTSFLQ
jgi:hypothetical protein